jgi:hypothetical protein
MFEIMLFKHKGRRKWCKLNYTARGLKNSQYEEGMNEITNYNVNRYNSYDSIGLAGFFINI